MIKIICRIVGHNWTAHDQDGIPALKTCKRCHDNKIIGPGGIKILQQRNNPGSDALAYVTSLTRRQTVTREQLKKMYPRLIYDYKQE